MNQNMLELLICRAGIILAALLAAGQVLAQDLPSTQIWLAEIRDGLPAEPAAISEGTGYNNQPLFSGDGLTIYFTAEQEDGQTDISRYEITTRRRSTIASSPESEYSPTPIPGQKALSVVRVEPDGRQRLWRIDLQTGGFGLLLPGVEPVGYHTWHTNAGVALFVLGETFSLHSAFIGDQPSRMVHDNIGRTLRSNIQTGKVYFVDKNAEPWTISEIDMNNGEVRMVISLFPGTEDFEMDHEGRFWMGSGSKLYRSDPANRNWQLTADLRGYGIDNITRLGASPNGKMLAIVGGR
jgi:hypothetical protein